MAATIESEESKGSVALGRTFISHRQRRALRLLLSAPRGLTDNLLRVPASTPELLTELVACASQKRRRGTVMRGGRTILVIASGSRTLAAAIEALT